MSEHSGVDGIAIVGMAGRFPGAPDVDTFWSNLCAGVESVRSFSDDELRAAGADTGDPGVRQRRCPDGGHRGLRRRLLRHGSP